MTTRFSGQIGAVVADLLDHLLQDRVQPPGADVLVRAVHLEGDVRDRLDAVLRELELHALGLQQFRVLLRQRVLRLGEDAEEVGARQVGQFDANRETAPGVRASGRRASRCGTPRPR